MLSFSRSLLIAFFITCFFWQNIAQASDPVITWIEKTNVSSVSQKDSWVPGVWWLDETELRMEMDDRGDSAQQSMRFSLKPLLGLSNEKQIMQQRQKIRDLQINGSSQQRLLFSYMTFLEAWQLTQALKIIASSEKVFTKARSQIKKLTRSSTEEFDHADFIHTLAEFDETKARLKSKKRQLISYLQKKGLPVNSYLKKLSQYSFIKTQQLHKKVAPIRPAPDPFRLEQKQLDFLKLKQKKKEAYQLVKFVSVGRQQRPTREDYDFQVSFRIPFLSDSSELKQAQADYAVSKQQLSLENNKLNKEFLQLKSQMEGLSAKYQTLSYLPQSSEVWPKLKNNLISIPKALKSESNLLKAKMQRLRTQTEIYQTYLTLLYKSGQLKQPDKNYLAYY